MNHSPIHPLDKQHYVQSWAFSFLVHGVVVVSAVAFLGDVKLAPQPEPFKWEVSLVQPQQTTVPQPVQPRTKPTKTAEVQPQPVESTTIVERRFQPKPVEHPAEQKIVEQKVIEPKPVEEKVVKQKAVTEVVQQAQPPSEEVREVSREVPQQEVREVSQLAETVPQTSHELGRPEVVVQVPINYKLEK